MANKRQQSEPFSLLRRSKWPAVPGVMCKKMYESKLEIPNKTTKQVSVWIEPWAMHWDIPAGSVCIMESNSPIEGELELEEVDDGLQVWGWCGSNLKIYIDSKLEWDTEELRVPGLPEGMSTKDFVGMAFDNNPSTARPKPKKWWQFWQ